MGMVQKSTRERLGGRTSIEWTDDETLRWRYARESDPLPPELCLSLAVASIYAQATGSPENIKSFVH